MIFQNELAGSFRINGQAIAIEDENQAISYSDLWQTAGRITHILLDLRLEKGTPIGVLLNDKSSLIAAMIGVMNARCAFFAVDGTWPENRLASMIEDLGLRYMITSRSSRQDPGKDRHAGLELLFWEELVDPEQNREESIPEGPVFEEEDSLYIYFTSGSTGRPKGIIGKNESLLQFLQWEIAEFQLECGRYSQFVHPVFDAFLRDVFVPLLTGGTICIPPPDKSFFVAETMIAWLSEKEITLIHCVPSIFRLINHESLLPFDLKSLRYVLLSGEKIIPSTLVKWYKIFGTRIQLVNLYGPTETTMIRSFHRIIPSDLDLARIPVGYPIAGTEILISRNGHTPCPVLVPGELYIITKYATKGYVNNPESNKERFVLIDAGTPAERVAFRTGDIARRLSSGEIDLLGREDRQVKIRGIRIEIDEIERILIRCEWVENVVVALRMKEQEPESDVLVAFVIRKAAMRDSGDLTAVLMQFAKDHLPEYMIPADMVELDVFPLLASGKINYQELLLSLPSVEMVLPADEWEEKVADIWKEILGDRPISTEASFIKTGGSSLSIMRLISQIYKVFHVRIPLQDLFTSLTIQQQARLIRNAQRDELSTIPKAAVKPVYHLSSAQQQMYYYYELDKSGTVYHLSMAWSMTEELDKVRIGALMEIILKRHEALRTAFVVLNGNVLQAVRDAVDLIVEEIDARAEATDIALHRFFRPFELNRAPLLRCGIIHTRDQGKMLVCDIHHIVCDGISQQIIYGEFIRLLRGESLPPVKLQYKDYAEWEYNLKRTESYMRSREFWLNSFEGGVPRLELPFADKGSKMVAGEGRATVFVVDGEAIDRILGRLREKEMTAFTGIFSIFYLFLYGVTGQDDIVVGVPVSGRVQEGLEEVVGMFVRTLPIRYKVDPDLSFMDIAIGLHHYFVRASDNQLYDLSDIVSEINKRSAFEVKDLFEVMFAFLDYTGGRAIEQDRRFLSYDIVRNSAKYPLLLIVDRNESSFQLRFEYSLQHFTGEEIASLVLQFQSLVEKVAENMDGRIREVIQQVPAYGTIAPMKFWRRYLAGVEWNDYLAVAGSRSPGGERALTEFQMHAPVELNRQFLERAGSDSSRYATLLTALGVLAVKYSGSGDVVIFGPHFSAELSVDANIPLMPVRMRLGETATFEEWVRDTEASLSEGGRYSHYPIEKIIGVDRNALSSLPVIGMQMEGNQSGPSPFLPSLWLSFATDQGLCMKVSYNPLQYSTDQIRRLCAHYFTLLSGLLTCAGDPVSGIGLLSGAESDQLLYVFNGAEESVEDRPVISLFEEQVIKTPGNIAVISSQGQYTYEEIDLRANRIGDYLTEQGIGRGDVVGLIMDRGERLVISILGILKAGAAFLPIDKWNPRSRIEYILKDSDVRIAFTDDLADDAWEPDGCRLVNDDGLWAQPAPATMVPRSGKGRGEDLMYTIYTSGTTGRPKGTLIRNRQYINLINWYSAFMEVTEKSNFMLISSIGFDLTYKNMFAPLLCGGRVTAVENTHNDYDAIARFFEETGVTHVNCAPAAFYLLLDKKCNGDYRRLRTLEKVNLGGEPINLRVFTDWRDSGYFNCRIINSYGPTECTDIASMYLLTDEDLEHKTVVPIGKPGTNIQMHIVGDGNRLQPIGLPGEICIGGIAVGDGYHNNEELTREKFVPNPFRPGRMYRTGDIGFRDEDGNIVFMHRKDNQVKIRGFRVELSEIEQLLLAHGEVKEAVVVIREKEGDKYLAAYFTSEDGETVDLLREYLSEKLPDHMIPAYFVRMDKLPLNANGKVDRKSLPEPVMGARASSGAANRTQQDLVGIWADVLHTDPLAIGIYAGFYAMGGNSVQMVQMIRRVNDHFKTEIPLAKMFEFSNISGIAVYLDQLSQEDTHPEEGDPDQVEKAFALYDQLRDQ